MIIRHQPVEINVADNNKDTSKNMLIIALLAVVLGLGVIMYQKSQEPEGISIEVSEDGISIDEN